MNAGNYQNLFKTFVANLCNGNFVGTFDKQKIDGIVTKAEFQEVMFLDTNIKDFAEEAGWDGNSNNTSGYRDLVDSFWNSFDINNGDGKIKGSSQYNLNALDKTESTEANTDLKIHKILSDALDSIKQYTNVYNYLLNKLVSSNDKSLEELQKTDVTSLVNEIIVQNTSAVALAMKNDVMENILKAYQGRNIKGFYDINNDNTLKNRINSVELAEITNFDSLDTITTWIEDSKSRITVTTDNYFNKNMTSSLDKENEWQYATLQKTLYDTVYATIEEEFPELKNSNFNFDDKIKSVIKQYIDDILANYETTLFINAKNNFAISFKNSTEGNKLIDYLYTLSLYDVEEINGLQILTKPFIDSSENFEENLYAYLTDSGYSDKDARLILKYLADNDIANAQYQNLVQATAQEVYNDPTDLDKKTINELLIEKLGIGSANGILSQTVIDSILNPTGSSSVTGEDIGEAGGTGSSESIKFMNKDDIDVYAKTETTADNMKIEIKRVLDDIERALVNKGYNSQILNTILDELLNHCQTFIDNIVRPSNGRGDQICSLGIIEYWASTTSVWVDNNAGGHYVSQYAGDNFKVNSEKLKQYINDQYNKKLSESSTSSNPTDLRQLNNVTFENGQTITEILTSDTVSGLNLTEWGLLDNMMKSSAKNKIEETLTALGKQLIAAGMSEIKVNYAITTTINLYHAAIDSIKDEYTNSGTYDTSKTLTYNNANGEDITEDYNIRQCVDEYAKDFNLTDGSSITGLTTSGGLGLRLAEAFNYGGGDNTADDNRYCIGVNIRCLLETVNRFLQL